MHTVERQLAAEVRTAHLQASLGGTEAHNWQLAGVLLQSLYSCRSHWRRAEQHIYGTSVVVMDSV